MMKKSQKYKGFEVLDVLDLTDLDARGFYLKHEKSGLEVFHISCSDDENLFSLTFRTPVDNGLGCPHVLEHSVLCGSEKYPLKDPFIRLSNQSINTYLNAFTSENYTCFPASSTVREDFFNLMSVYADAVFFPLLRPEVFMQECWRLEFDENKKPRIQGVVYNEMKGVYSSFNRIAGSEIEKAVTPSKENDFGGNPSHIPELTYKEFRDFHKKHYTTSNCFVFLYGNIPTEDHLDFLDVNIISRVKTFGKPVSLSKEKKCQIKPFVRATGPANENSENEKNILAQVYKLYLPKKDFSLKCMELAFLEILLLGNDCAPVSKAMLDSGLCEDIAPFGGVNYNQQNPSFSFAVRGVEKKNYKKFQKLIDDTVKDICDRGISMEDVERACMAFDFHNRDNVRYYGPFSLVLMRRTIKEWLYGECEWSTVEYGKLFARVKENIRKDPCYITSLIRKYILENGNRSLVVVEPSSAWNKKFQATEKAQIKRLLEVDSKENYARKLEMMHKFQSSQDSGDDNIIPRLNVKDLTVDVEKVSVREKYLNGDIPFISCQQPTNGISNIIISLRADVLSPKDYPYLGLFAECLTEVGWKGCSWDKATSRLDAVTGSYSACCTSHVVPEAVKNRVEGKIYSGRDGVDICVKFLEEKSDEVFLLLTEMLSSIDFSDTARIRDLITSCSNSASASFASGGYGYAASRSSCMLNRHAAVHELWEGLTACVYINRIASENIDAVARRFRRIFREIKEGGVMFFAVGTKAGVADAAKKCSELAGTLGLSGPAERKLVPDKEFYQLLKLDSMKGGISSKTKNKNVYAVDELIEVPGTVAFDSFCFEGSPYGSRESVADSVFNHYMGNNELWQKVRTEGGAYGVYVSTSEENEISKFSTYRDPKPYESIEAFVRTVNELTEKEFTQEEVDKAIIGCYSDEITPKSPMDKGIGAIVRMIAGETAADKRKSLSALLRITPKDMHEAALRYSENIRNNKIVVVCGSDLISEKTKSNSSKIIRMGL